MEINLTASVLVAASAGAGKPRRFKIEAYNGGKLHVDGFDLPVVVDLQGLTAAESIAIVLNHEPPNTETTVGSTDIIANDGKSLSLSGPITGDHRPRIKAVIDQFDKGQKWQASIGALVTHQQEIAAGQRVTVNGQTFDGPIIVARRAELKHTGILPSGADPSTSVNLAAAAATTKEKIMTFEEFLTSLGVDQSKLDDTTRPAFQMAFDAMNGAPAAASAKTDPDPEKDASMAAAAAITNLNASITTQINAAQKQLATRLRQNAEIQAKAASHPMIAAKAIEEGWSIEKTELEVLKASSASGTRPTSFHAAQDDPANLGNVLEAALCTARNLTNNGRRADAIPLDKQFDDKTLQAAHTKFRGAPGLQQIMIQCAAANGMPLQAGMKLNSAGAIREVLSYACPQHGPQSLQAGFSTLSLPGILSNVANKEILQGYMEEDATWRDIAQIKPVSDFKTVTSYRMLDDMAYEKLPPGDSIKHGKTGEESFTRAVDTYAKMYVLTRTDIINDDLGAFDDLRFRIGAGSAIKLNDLFWTTFLANLATIFTSTRTNYISGSTTNLGADGVGLGLGQKAWRTRRSSTTDGSKRLGGIAKFVLVPPELETIADALYQGRNLGAVKVSDGNTFANKYQPIVAEQLSDSAYTGYSTTAWYMIGDKSKGSPVVVSFLNGQETPTVDSADADFHTLGIQFRGYHDFGCDLGDGYLNALMSKGAA